MRAHNTRLFRIARAILQNDAEAEDVVQDAYVQGFLHIADFRADGRLDRWFATIVVNLARERLRRSRRRIEAGIVEQPMEDDLIDRVARRDGMTPERQAASSELRNLLESGIDELPDGFREVFVLRAIEELSTEETARILSILPATVKTRFHRARGMMQRAVGDMMAAAIPEAFPFAGARCDRIVATVLSRLEAANKH